MKFLQFSIMFLVMSLGVIPAPAHAQEPAPKTDNKTPAKPAEAKTPAQPATPAPAPAEGTKPADGAATKPAVPASTPAEGTKPADGAAAQPANPAAATPAAGTQPAAGNDSSPATTTPAQPAAPVKQPEPVKQAKPVKQEKPAQPAAGHAGGHGSDAFTIENMWAASSGPVRVVLVMLLLMLVACIGIALERLNALSNSKGQSNSLADAIGGAMKDGNIQQALKLSQATEYEKSHLARLLQAGLKEFSDDQSTHGIDAVERVLEKNYIGEGESLRKGLNILATTGATAPFVGLVGTIFGIINAFQQIGADGGGDLMKLAPAIGEALITTAFGIIVAIVGVWLFNYFTAVIENITNDMTMNSQDFIHWCHKQLKKPSEKAALDK